MPLRRTPPYTTSPASLLWHALLPALLAFGCAASSDRPTDGGAADRDGAIGWAERGVARDTNASESQCDTAPGDSAGDTPHPSDSYIPAAPDRGPQLGALDFRLVDDSWLSDPHVFDCAAYRQRNADLAALDCTAASAHWLRAGAREGRIAHDLFHVKEYRALYPDLQAGYGADYRALIEHYVRHGLAEGRVGRYMLHSAVFDCPTYLQRFGDLAAPSCEAASRAWVALLEAGHSRGAHPLFNVVEYLALYPDLIAAFGKNHLGAVIHYVRYGHSEGRVGRPYLAAHYFNCPAYASYNPDLASYSCDELKRHWINHGLREGRRAHESFAIRSYLPSQKPLLAARFGNHYALAWHYLVHFEAERPYTLRALPSDPFAPRGQPFAVADYRDSADGDNWAPAIARAIAAASAYTAQAATRYAQLRFPAGSLRLDGCLPAGQSAASNPLNVEGFCFRLYQAQRLQLIGDPAGTTLLNTNPQTGTLLARSCTEVYLQGLTIDYNVAPFVQGTIEKIVDSPTGISFELVLDTSLRAEPFAQFEAEIATNLGILLDARRPLRKPDTASFFRPSRLVALAANRWRFEFMGAHASWVRRDVVAGDRFTYVRRGSSALHFLASKGVGVQRLVLLRSPGLATGWVANEGPILIDDFQLRRGPGSWFVSSNVDGIHAQQNRSPLTIQNSYFEGMGDDAINIYSAGGIVVAGNAAERQLVVDRGSQLRIGDQLQLVDPQSGTVLGTPTVSTASGPTNGRWQVTLSAWSAGIDTGGNSPPATLAAPYANTVVFNLSAAGRASRITNNIFGPLRARQILVKAPGALIEGNDFLLPDISAIRANALYHSFVEGPVPNGMTITNNRFDGARSSEPTVLFGNAAFAAHVSATSPAANISFTNNRLDNCSTECLRANALRGISVRDNRFRADGDTLRSDWQQSADQRHIVDAIGLDAGLSAFSFANNSAEDPRPETSAF